MARQLTIFSKLLITIAIIAALFFGIQYLLNNTDIKERLGNADKIEQNDKANSSEKSDRTDDAAANNKSTVISDDEDVLTVQLVTWGGYAPGLYFNEGAEPTTRSRFYKDYGLKVRFVLDDDLIKAQQAWVADEYDVLVQTADAFPLYTAPEAIAQFNPKAFMQVDWSRGGDVIIAKRNVNSINDLKGRKVAVTEPSPSQTLLITALEAAGLDYSDITPAVTQDNFVAATTFKAPDVDAAVVWSPSHFELLEQVPGSKILLTTAEQSHIIADIMFAKGDYIAQNRDKINAFYEGWMKAVAELNANESNQDKAAKILGEFLGFSAEDAAGAMSEVHWATHGDNVNFFGLSPNYKGMLGVSLYDKMNQKFFQLKANESLAPPWRSVINTGAISAASAKLSGPDHAAENEPEFKPATAEDRNTPALATKPVSISFGTGQYALTENAKTIIDLQFADIAKSFANMRVRVEGNTDDTGSRETNMRLSQQRAKSVSDYLIQTYGMNPNRFIVVGNGPDNPVAGCENSTTDACRSKNRRTEFQLVPAG